MNTSPRECSIENCTRVGKPSGGGKRAGLCREHYKKAQHTSTEKEYIAKVIEEFRSKFVRDDGLMDKYYTYGMGEPGDYTCSMAEAIEDFFKDKLEEAMEQGVMDCRDESHQKITELERSRILSLVKDTKKRFKCGACEGPNNLSHTMLCAALTSLADEIISQRK